MNEIEIQRILSLAAEHYDHDPHLFDDEVGDAWSDGTNQGVVNLAAALLGWSGDATEDKVRRMSRVKAGLPEVEPLPTPPTPEQIEAEKQRIIEYDARMAQYRAERDAREAAMRAEAPLGESVFRPFLMAHGAAQMGTSFEIFKDRRKAADYRDVSPYTENTSRMQDDALGRDLCAAGWTIIDPAGVTLAAPEVVTPTVKSQGFGLSVVR